MTRKDPPSKLRQPGAADASRRLVINFHGIGQPWDGVPDAEKPYWCPDAEWLAMADCLAEVSEQGHVKVEITFDDGNVSDIEAALPALQERGLRATFFVCAGRLGKRQFLSVDDLMSLQAAGMGIGSHGWDHRDLRTVSDAEMPREVSESRVRIADAVGREVNAFAVPFGSYNRRVLRYLRGYAEVLTSDRKMGSISGWLIPRYSYVRGWGPSDVRAILTTRRSLANELIPRAAILYKRLR